MTEEEKQKVMQDAKERREGMQGGSKAQTRRNILAAAQQDAKAKEWSTRGGQSTSVAKAEAARINGKLGGRPKVYPSVAARQKAWRERKAKEKQC